jgi:hypothetical protein
MNSATGSDRSRAEQAAREWTSALMDQAWGRDDAIDGELPPTPVPGVDLDDIAGAVVDITGQLRSLEQRNRMVPVVVAPRLDLVLPVDMDELVDPTGAMRLRDVDQWIDRANEGVVQLAQASSFSYEELPVSQVTDILENATSSLVATRILAFKFGDGAGPRLHTVTVHTSASGLRVHWSLALAWRPVFFGAPTPTVTAQLQDGKYNFGVDSRDMPMKIDEGLFDIPMTVNVDLAVA